MRRIGKSAAALLIIGAAVWLSVEYDLQGTLRDLLSWVEGQGAVGVITFIVAYIAATVLFIPGSILTLGAGFVFGVLEGVAYVSVASTLGAT
ncbi:MAG: hypothetical protein ACOC47_03425, partial [Alkalispirochaetaceae bacterium]